MNRLLIFIMIFAQVTLVSAAPQNGTKWNIVSKSCDAKPEPISSPEMIYIQDSFLGHIYVQSENQEKKCLQIHGGLRLITNSTSSSEMYYEESILTAKSRLRRTVCQNKATGEILSDITESFDAPDESIKVTLFKTTGKGDMDISNSVICEGGTLHMELQKKQSVVIKNLEFQDDVPVQIDLD